MPDRQDAESQSSLEVEVRSDAALLEAVRTGDAGAWRALVERHARLVFSIPLRLGLQQADAEEVFQNTWATLHEYIGQIRDLDRVRAWIVTTATRESWRQARGLRAAAASEPDELCAAPDPGEGLEELESAERVQAAVTELRPACRALIEALFYAPTTPSYEDLAVRLGVPIGSIGPTRARCLAQLARVLERYGLA